MLLAELRDLYRNALTSEYPKEEIDQVFHTLLEFYLELPRFILGLEPQRSLTKQEEEPMLRALGCLLEHVPVQHITGRAHFMGMDLRVGPDVLIPRPETEGLVRWVLETCKDSPPKRLLDAGTGSGCIALSLAREWSQTEVHALDISPEALAMARKNAQELRLPVHFHQADLCKPSSLGLTFDLIVSNPPYIPRSERSGMQARVRESEPELALFAPTEDPLKYYHCLLRLGLQRMPEGGTVYVETHYLWAGQVAAAFEASGYEEISLKKDIFGKERYVRGKVPADRSKK